MHLTRVALAAGVVAVALIGAACGTRDSPASQPGDWRDDLRALRMSTDVALPVALPPGFREIAAVTGTDLPLVSFYSTNEPIVTVCTGDRRACIAATSAEVTLQSVTLGESDVVVLVDPGEVTKKQPLSEELATFWTDVSLTTASPGWLGAAGS